MQTTRPRTTKAWLEKVDLMLLLKTARPDSEHLTEVAVGRVLEGYRVEVDARSERMNLKIRHATMQKVPYMLVVGDTELNSNAVAVRHRQSGDLGAMPMAGLLERLGNEVTERT